MLKEKDDDAPRLVLREGIGACPQLRPASPGQVKARLWPPILRIVAVEVQAADAVFVEFSIQVVINPFTVNDIISFSLARSLHQTAALIARIKDIIPFSFLNLFSHLVTESVSIQILGRVLIQQTVAVRVVGPDRAAVTLGRVEIKL
jgi:hypothetical protein